MKQYWCRLHLSDNTGICLFTSWLSLFVIQVWRALSYLPCRAFYEAFKHTVKLSLGSWRSNIWFFAWRALCHRSNISFFAWSVGWSPPKSVFAPIFSHVCIFQKTTYMSLQYFIWYFTYGVCIFSMDAWVWLISSKVGMYVTERESDLLHHINIYRTASLSFLHW